MARRLRTSVQDRCVLITGAASGIGRAAAQGFRDAGARVVLLDVDADPLAKAAGEIDASAIEGHPVLGVECDLRDHACRAEAVGEIDDRMGGIDVLINNAGLLMGGPFHEGDPARMHDVIEVNLCASIGLTRLVLPSMIERGRGHILNVVSSSAEFGVPGFAVYAATKSGLTSFTRILRRELTGTGVRLTTLCPGSTTTSMTRSMLAHGKGAGGLPHHPASLPAAAMLDAVERGLERVAVSAQPRRMALVSFLDRVFPSLMNRYWERQVEEGAWLESARSGGCR